MSFLSFDMTLLAVSITLALTSSCLAFLTRNHFMLIDTVNVSEQVYVNVFERGTAWHTTSLFRCISSCLKSHGSLCSLLYSEHKCICFSSIDMGTLTPGPIKVLKVNRQPHSPGK